MNNPVKVIVKFFSYILGKIIAVVLALAIMVLVFITAMNTMNVQVMVKDAFALRSSVMLVQYENENTELLDRVFSEDYIKKHNLKELTDNKAYEVTNYNQDTDIEFKLIWPWMDEVELQVTDVVEDVRANLVSQVIDESIIKENYLMDSGKYTVLVRKTDDGWIVEDAIMDELIEPEVIFPLPTPSRTEVESDETEEESSSDDNQADISKENE